MRSSRLPLALCVLSFGILFAALALLAAMHVSAGSAEPSPDLPPAKDEDGFPAVDWDYWKDVNPDVIGWISIPDATLSLPIVQAPASDPQKYLTHDVYGNWSYMGCPYLDADCAEAGLEESPNAVIYGHNLGFGDESMFATVARYSDQRFMEEHGTILLQTPKRKMRFQALSALCTDGGTPSNRTSFEDQADLASWLAERMEESQTVCQRPPSDPRQILTLCTCSYTHLENERTILFSCRTQSTPTHSS